jgi:alpha-tubulin suppressor-like RCC1 family protein
MSNFTNSTDGDLTQVFITEYDLIDRYVGNKLWAWGSNSSGQLGDNTTDSKSSPVQTVAGGTNWKSISAKNAFHITGIKTDGTLWLWGNNDYGQLGDESINNKSSPVQTVAAGTTWKQVATSNSYTAAIKTDGTLWLWGYNSNGHLGDNTTDSKSSPVQTVAGGTNWKSISLGTDVSAAIKTDGTLWMWGANGYGELGTNDSVTQTISSPVQTVAGGSNWKQVSAGQSTAAIKTDGTLWTWGLNDNGQLGDNSVVHKSSPVQTVAGGSNWKQVSCGIISIGAIKTDGTLWVWGANSYGGLGDGTNISRSSPVQTVAGGTNWKQVSLSDNVGAAIKTDGTLWTWGLNFAGELGDGTTTVKSSPVQTVAGGTNWKQVDCAGSYNIYAVTYGD